ncbi:MAG: FecR domain-containing protein [Planctomycetota bacterium]
MAGCEQSKRWLPAHALGELEEADRAALSEHLASCEACRREEARVAHALSALRAMPEVPPSALRRERALAAARAMSPAPRRRRWAWVAAVAAVLLVGVFVRQAVRRPQPFTLSVEGVQGVVEREVGGQWVAAAAGEPVGEGARLRTALGRASLRSSRGDLVVLDVDSVLSVGPTDEAEEGVLLQSGRLWCEATKRQGRRLVVRTPAGSVEVVGTRFEVSYR